MLFKITFLKMITLYFFNTLETFAVAGVSSTAGCVVPVSAQQ